jgi:hypothetical protein
MPFHVHGETQRIEVDSGEESLCFGVFGSDFQEYIDFLAPTRDLNFLVFRL